MANETMRIFFPLKIVTYPQGEYGMEDNPVEITPAEAVAYEDDILAAIAKENSKSLQVSTNEKISQPKLL